MSVAWPGVGRRIGRGTKAEGLAALLGALGTVGLLAIGRGSGMPAIMFYCIIYHYLLSCSIAHCIDTKKLSCYKSGVEFDMNVLYEHSRTHNTF